MLLDQIEDQFIGFLAHLRPHFYATHFDLMAAIRQDWGKPNAQIYVREIGRPGSSAELHRSAGSISR